MPCVRFNPDNAENQLEGIMQNYPSDKLRNLCVVAHSGTGKTSLGDAVAWLTKINDRFGKVDDGSSCLDTTPDEVENKITISAKLMPVEWQGHKLNWLDTPGYADFYGEVVAAASVCEQALVLIDGVAGAEIGTERVWRECEERNLPTLVFVNKLDKERATLDGALASLKESFKARVVPLTLPIGKEAGLTGVVEVLSGKAWTLSGDKFVEGKIPADMQGAVDLAKAAIIEEAAGGDDALMEKFLEAGTLDEADMQRGLRLAFAKRALIPVFCGAANRGIGVGSVLNFLVEYGISPLANPGFATTKDDTLLKCDPAAPALAFVFKVMVEQHAGELNFVRVIQGKLTSGADVHNTGKQGRERIGQMLVVRGKGKEEIKELAAGDMAALVKLRSTAINDTLSAKLDVQVKPIVFPQPLVAVAVAPKAKNDQEKLSVGLASFTQEDPTFKVEHRPEFSETVVLGMGEKQLNLKMHKLKKKYNVDVDLLRPKVPYRETIKAKGDAKHRHKKQTGGAGQFAEVWMRVEPLPRGTGLQFVNSLVGQNVDRVFVPSVEKGVNAAATQGVYAGYKVIDVKVDFYDGKMHPVDSKDIAFQTAGKAAFKEAFLAAKPVLLEPVLEVEITVGSEHMGDVIGNINTRRGKMLGSEARGRFQVISAHVPEAEMYNYATDLRSMTQGKGTFGMKFSHYEEVPHEMAQKIIAESKKEDKEE